ncbi:hypothetical protein EV284_3479 [Streptomyces sp. BK022]|uniref:hypothetical protein n=1 Tax=Streptomyces sp. BK022 TaxID=2512123 RepID=UPI0010297970|nr:hypothetical protein [Streptomyces sp. BK022]RZU35996.1 hypothetical protein EV284_3479 [Streptomyces sp. BK022]
MARGSRKRTWYTRLRSSYPVAWYCLHRDTRKSTEGMPWDTPWARFVVLQTETEDGRPLDTVLTPNEARVLARRLNMAADGVEQSNIRQGNGWTADAVREEA